MRLPALLLTLCLALLPAPARADDPPKSATPEVKRTEDVVYGRKFGVALTLDVFRPANANGKALVFIVSGGWYSAKEAIQPKLFEPALKRGYTVFAAVHGSQPKFHIPEVANDVHRAVRYVRHNAKRFEIDPDHVGVTGFSAGGHLTLTLATQGGPGDPKAPDPIDRESSAVQAAVAFFPPTDFLNYGKPGEDAVGVGTLKDYRGAFGPLTDTPEGRRLLGKLISPANYIRADLPPTLIIHGDADKLVPVQQARLFAERAAEVKATVKVIERPGKAHGWPDFGPDLDATMDWFDEHLAGKAAGEKK